MPDTMQAPVTPVEVSRSGKGPIERAEDLLVTEEPLEIRLDHGPVDDRREDRITVTMRTPGDDRELAIGFLLSEGILSGTDDIIRVEHCQQVKPEEMGNVVRVSLKPEVQVDTARWQRNFYVSSSCGVCGKGSLEAVRNLCPVKQLHPPTITRAVLLELPRRMREAQVVFQHTGGIHAAALFDPAGKLLLLHEDVGRHNAVDKVIGAAQLADLPLVDRLLLVSGRAGFELVQKCVMAGIPAMAAVGAPSSLAVQLAKDNLLLLIGFLRDDRFNVYSGDPALIA